MGRTVSTPLDAIATVYVDVSYIEDGYDWEDFVDNIRHTISHRYRSLDECSVWSRHNDECRWILENDFATVQIAEYCGLASISLVSKSRDLLGTGFSDDACLANVADGWCNRISRNWANLVRETFNGLKCIGVASNGEAFYSR